MSQTASTTTCRRARKSVVSPSELLELASGGYLRANVHRVVSPPQQGNRLSVAFFLGARLDSTVPVLDLALVRWHQQQRRTGPAPEAGCAGKDAGGTADGLRMVEHYGLESSLLHQRAGPPATKMS